MKISKEARKLSKKLYLSSFTDSRLDDSKVRHISQSVAAKKPRKYLDILKNYHRLLRIENAKRHAIIESAVSLDSGIRDQMIATLRAKYGAELTTEFKVVPELIGGVRIRLGSNVWDSSVRGRLSKLESNLATA